MLRSQNCHLYPGKAENNARATPWEPEMLCWLVVGGHEALRESYCDSKIVILRRNQQSLLEFTPRMAVQTLSAPSAWEPEMLCWLIFGDHEALK